MIIPIKSSTYDLFYLDLYSSPPKAQTTITRNPALLVSWWCTGFALTIILVRLAGRYIRTEKLFREDKIMALAIIPLLIRMAFAHCILRWGTNNAMLQGMTAEELHYRELGSRMVLPARIFYAAFLWTAKLTISEFLKRLNFGQVWKKSYQTGLQVIRWFLGVTFVVVVIVTLSECTPFDHYWQVVPDPGPRCRQAFAQLITMGAADTITDLALVGFPITIVLASKMPMKRKFSLCLLFSLSLFLVFITLYRVIEDIDRHGQQQFRTLLASIEILAAAAVSNAIVLGSFVRDRGIKKQRFKYPSTSGSSSLDRPAMAKSRPRAALSWGSDIDLVGDLGLRLGPEFHADKSTIARPAPAVMPLSPVEEMPSSQYSFLCRESEEDDETDLKIQTINSEGPPSPPDILTPRRMSFFDVGGLLEDNRAVRMNSSNSDMTRMSQPLLSSANATLRERSPSGARALLEDMAQMPEERLPRSRSIPRKATTAVKEEDSRPPTPPPK